MKKILTQKEIESKRKRNIFVMGGFMLLVLVLSTASYGFLYSGDKNQNNQDNDNRFFLDVAGKKIYFSYKPEDVKDINISGTYSANDYAGKLLYVDGENQAVINELASTIGSFSRVQRACYGGCGEDLPEKTCQDNLIVWKDSAENKVYKENNCVFIEGDLRAVDAFLFKVFEVN